MNVPCRLSKLLANGGDKINADYNIVGLGILSIWSRNLTVLFDESHSLVFVRLLLLSESKWW